MGLDLWQKRKLILIKQCLITQTQSQQVRFEKKQLHFDGYFLVLEPESPEIGIKHHETVQRVAKHQTQLSN